MRKGLTLIELIVVIAIIAILVALTLVGVQRVRSMALLTQSQNNVRQIGLAFQSYAAARKGHLPGIADGFVPQIEDLAPFLAIERELASTYLFLSPADPSLYYSDPTKPGLYDQSTGLSSYAYNATVFHGTQRLLLSISDGTSNTIGIAEHYAKCAEKDWVVFIYSLRFSSGGGGPRRPSFADAYYGDVIPVTSRNPPRTAPSIPDMTFQLAPALAQSDSRVPQSPHSNAMIVGMMDGSVRLINRNVSVEVFWGAVTPNGNEPDIDF
jgi:prepilin-type N-terminal cleavage/methylation domain-containing protein